MTAIVAQDFWDQHWDKVSIEYDEQRVLFRDLFDRYLPKGGTCFEVGCYPGNFLVYLAKRFGYRVSGVDMTPHTATVMAEHLARNGIAVDDLIHGDFLSFSSPREYDVVCSFGFVEHFVDYAAILRRHVNLVAPGGTLVVSCPNMRGVQRMMHSLVDGQNLRRHVLDAMDLRAWSRVLGQNGMEILHAGYYRTADFWSESEQNKVQYKLDRIFRRTMKWIDKRVTYPNRFTSPYMILFARKPNKM